MTAGLISRELTAALTAAVDAGVVTRWQTYSANPGAILVLLHGSYYRVWVDDLPTWLAERVRHMGASTSRFLLPAQHRAWSVMLDRLGDLAETLPWWEVTP